MKIVHLSDLHVSSRDSLEYLALDMIVHHVIKHHADAVVCITGDFVNDGRHGEFLAVEPLIRLLVEHCAHVILLPGNHDVEFMGSLGRVDRNPFFEFYIDLIPRTHAGWPCMRFIDGVQIITLDSTLGAGGIGDLARGKLGYTQRELLAQYLKIGNYHTRVVMLHHHPFDRGLGLELIDADELLATLSGRCDLLLFGHRHESAIWRGLYGIGWMAAAGKSTTGFSYRVFDIQPGKISYTEEKL